jgi:PAS domain S-box-containing protein
VSAVSMPSSPPKRASVLLVDDRRQNLVALQAILDPLGHELVTANSGDEALRVLLQRDFAAILLDVQMPGLDGFATAELIKRRERTRYIPIIFLTAYSRDEQQVFRGYSAGAVDYLTKPFEPDVLRSKVSVFVDLWQKNEQLREHEERLRREELAAATRVSEERYRTLAEAMPQIVWTADGAGATTYVNERWYEYTGLPAGDLDGAGWASAIHSDDLPGVIASWQASQATGGEWGREYRLRNAAGAYRWHLGRSLPLLDEHGLVSGWVGTATDIDDRKRAEERQRFLVEAGSLLGSSLDVDRTLTDVANAAVPAVADWCGVDLVGADGRLHNLAVAHADPTKVQFVRELRTRYPPDPDAATGPPYVVRTGESELVQEITDEMLEAAARDELHLDLLRELALSSYMCVPLVSRDRVLGALTFVQAESGLRYGTEDLELAEELARRAATAIDNARLFEAQHEAAAEARENAARTSAVMESALDAVVTMDHEGKVLEFNPAAERMFGYAREDVLGREMASLLIPAHLRARHRKGLARYLRTGVGPVLGKRIELTALRTDGTEFPVELAITRIEADGPPTFTGYIRDITERLLAEEERSQLLAREHAARVEAEERAQAARVLATVGDGVVLVDGEGVIRLWNPAAEAITGLAAGDVLGRRASDVLSNWAELQPRVPVASEPRAVRAESLPVEVAGRELWLSIAGVGFDEGTVYAFRDLTEERALELMRSDFVATVSHELRTPLAAIHGAALTLLRTDLDFGDELRGRLLEIIGDESSRLAEIVNDLLLASHLDSGRLQLQIESCDARELAAGVLEAAGTHLPEDVSLDLDAPAALPPVAADRGQLHQVLANIVDNAIKYSPDGGPVRLALEARGSGMRFSVSDRGLGIPRVELQRVFEKFYRLDPNMTRGIGGTGLGLYICRELVRMMGGRIWVESTEGAGSTFNVEIPLAEVSRRRSTAARAAASGR